MFYKSVDKLHFIKTTTTKKFCKRQSQRDKKTISTPVENVYKRQLVKDCYQNI